MKVIGLTGGIGSGKTTVANMFKSLGVPVYIADDEARRLSDTSKVIRRELIKLLGEAVYINNRLDRKYVSNQIFKNSDLLKQVNEIIHPKVASHFRRWLKKQNAPYCIKEAAILFESGGYKQCDLTILVTSPIETRIKRVLLRDRTTKEAVLERINNQWTDERKRKLANIVIENVDLNLTQKEILKLHNSLL